MYQFLKAIKCVLVFTSLLSGVVSFSQKPSKPWWSFPSNQKSGYVIEVESFDKIENDSTFLLYETHYTIESSDVNSNYYQFWTFAKDSIESYDIGLFVNKGGGFDLYLSVNEGGIPVISPTESITYLYRKRGTNEYVLDWYFSPPLDQFYDPALEKRYFFKLKVPD